MHVAGEARRRTKLHPTRINDSATLNFAVLSFGVFAGVESAHDVNVVVLRRIVLSGGGMRRSLPVAGAFLLVCFGVSGAPRNAAQESPAQTPVDDYKITPEDIARKSPVKSSAEGLAEARRVFKYDCAMCHGEHGDGKGEVVESMKLTMHDWHDPAALEGKTDGEIFYIITKGKGKMMGEGDRQPEKLRWNLVNLVRAMAGKGTQAKSSAGASSSHR
jgi:cytochrome c5